MKTKSAFMLSLLLAGLSACSPATPDAVTADENIVEIANPNTEDDSGATEESSAPDTAESPDDSTDSDDSGESDAPADDDNATGEAPPANQPPTVFAGEDQSVSLASEVTLTAVASDADGETLTYAWTQSSGPEVTLSGADTATASFFPGETGEYVFEVTASDGTDTISDSVAITSNAVTNGDYTVDIYKRDKVAAGTTLFVDNRDGDRFFEVNMLGETVWDYAIPDGLQRHNTIGIGIEKISADRYLFQTGDGLFEIDGNSDVVWRYADTKNSHDLQRLSDNDTLYVFGNDDTYDDAQVKRVSGNGTLVWSWYAKDHTDHIPYYGDDSDGGWTHVNAAIWNSDDSVFINFRNQYKTLEVDADGDVRWEMDWSVYGDDVDPHEPDLLSGGRMIVCLQNDSPYVAVEIDRSTKEELWHYANTGLRTARDCDRLSNGNTLIVAVANGGTENAVSMDDDYSTLIEVTSEGEIVWRMTLTAAAVGRGPGYFYKAQRLETGAANWVTD